MSIANALIRSILFYGFLIILGRATIVFCCHQLDPLENHAISPVIGLAVLTLLTTYLVLLGIPLDIVARSMMLGIAVFAIIFLVLSPRGGFNKGVYFSFKYLAPLFVTALFLTLPFILGGYQFAILRGNGTDAFNYVTMADALAKFPMNWILSQTKETLSVQSPSLPLAQDLLHSRWSTSALLSFASSAFGISPVEFEYVFTLTIMVVIFNALIAALSAICSLTRLTNWLPVVFVVGFWGQFTLDIRAFSQIASLPILVVLIGWLLSCSNYSVPIFRYGISITAILFAALFFQYPEIVVAFLPGAGLIFLIFLLRTYRKNELTKEAIKKLAAFSLSTLFLITPLIKFIFRFAFEQVNSTANQSFGWEKAYFTWLKNPIQGLWGIAINPGLGHYFDNVFEGITFFIALVLTFGVITRVSVFLVLRQRLHDNLSEAGLFLIGISGLVGSIALFVRGNIWAAGKVLSYFSILIPIWMAIYISKKRLKESNSRLNKVLSRILFVTILGWMAINFIFAGARIVHAVNGNDFRNYIMHHGEYRRVNADIFSEKLISDCPIGSTVAVIDPRVWAREFKVHLLEGRGYKVNLPGIGSIRSGDLPDTVNSFSSSSYLLVGDGRFSTVGQGKTHPSIISLSSYLIGIVGINNDYGLEFDAKGRYVYLWNSGRPMEIKLFSDRESEISFEFELCPGKNRTETNPIFVYLGDKQKYVKLTQCTFVTIPQHVSKGVNIFRISVMDSDRDPTIIGKDTRDLRLLVKILGIEVKCGI